MMKTNRMAAWTIAVALVFALVTLFSTAGYAQTAKKAKKKSTTATATTQASAADQGPTLEQTLAFIESKFAEFYMDEYIYSDRENTKFRNQYRKVIYSSKGCSVKIEMAYYNFETKCTNSKFFEFNLADVSHVAADLFERNSVESGQYTYLRGDKPVYAVVVKSSKKKLLVQYGDNDEQKRLVWGEKWSASEISLPMKTQEYATRMAKAFERAAKLCGGGQDIGKKDLF